MVWASLQIHSLAGVVSSSENLELGRPLVITVNLVTVNVVTFGHYPSHYSINGSSVPDATFFPITLMEWFCLAGISIKLHRCP